MIPKFTTDMLSFTLMVRDKYSYIYKCQENKLDKITERLALNKEIV